MKKQNALRDLAQTAALPVMREIGILALASGYTQESLSVAYYRVARASGVIRHFETATEPKDSTIRRYAEILGVDYEYLSLVNTGRFLTEQFVQNKDGTWIRRSYVDLFALQFETDEWVDGAGTFILDSLQALDRRRKQEILVTFALTSYRAKFLEGRIDNFRAGRDEVILRAPELRINERRRVREPGELRFVDLWTAVGMYIDARDFDILLAAYRAMLQSKDVDLMPLDTALSSEQSYQSWRVMGWDQRFCSLPEEPLFVHDSEVRAAPETVQASANPEPSIV